MTDYLTVAEAAAYLKIARRTIYLLMTTNRLKWYEVEGVRGRRFRRDDLDKLVKEGKRT